jgi:hypothetical protein
MGQCAGMSHERHVTAYLPPSPGRPGCGHGRRRRACHRRTAARRRRCSRMHTYRSPSTRAAGRRSSGASSSRPGRTCARVSGSPCACGKAGRARRATPHSRSPSGHPRGPLRRRSHGRRPRRPHRLRRRLLLRRHHRLRRRLHLHRLLRPRRRPHQRRRRLRRPSLRRLRRRWSRLRPPSGATRRTTAIRATARATQGRVVGTGRTRATAARSAATSARTSAAAVATTTTSVAFRV